MNTRQALLEATLRMVEAGKSFDGLSLREVTREAGIVPTAFYRHFQDMDELGLALVDDAFRLLRQIILTARAAPAEPDELIGHALETLARHVREHRLHFRFLARVRNAGTAAMRLAIRTEIRLLTSELATDLARLPNMNRWSTEDRQMLAALVLDVMISTIERLLEVPPQRASTEQAAVLRLAEKQLRLILQSAAHWSGMPDR